MLILKLIFFLFIKKNNILFIQKIIFIKIGMKKNNDNLIQYILPVENIENIQKIKKNKDNIFKIKFK